MAKAKRRKDRLSGAIKVEQWAKGRCFKDFRGRAPLIDTCVQAVKDTTGLIVAGKAMYFSDAVDQNAKACLRIRNLNEQTACLTGTTEVLLRSKGQTASLDGKPNPFAVCKAAQKRHGFGKKKLERCIRAMKERLR